jgi:hypothetical protein
MIDVMIDLETLGKRAGCVVLSIGAVYFDPFALDQSKPILGQAVPKLGAEHYEVVRTSTCTAVGLHEDPETVAWWAKQSPEARRVLTQAAKSKGNTPLKKALRNLNEFLTMGGKRTVRVWGNGASFDNPILACAYAAARVELGWEFWNDRCYRTMKNMVPKGECELVRQGTYHNALDDAKSQAEHAMRLVHHLKLEVV